MRAVQAKASRRELRKAFGSDAVDTIGVIGTAVTNQGKALHAFLQPGGKLAELEARLDELEARGSRVRAILRFVVRFLPFLRRAFGL